jgi:hypothetical protein
MTQAGSSGPTEHAANGRARVRRSEEIMAINRASLSDPYISPAGMPRASRADQHDGDATRRTAMVVGGFVVALISLAVGSLALVQVWMAPNAVDGVNSAAPALQSWDSLAMIIGGGLGFAAGAALVGIGMGRWTSPRPPTSEADYTGPGDAEDMPERPRVV